VGVALGGAFGLVVAGLGVAAQPGDGDGVQGSVEAVPDPLPAAGFQRGGAGERGEGGLVADPAAVGPADEQLGGGDRADAGFGEQRRPGRMLFDQGEQFRVELGGLVEQEPDR
jgi:hypothetical protein